MDNSLDAAQQDSKNMGLLIWILTIFFGFLPGFIFYLVKKDDPYIQDQAKEALNWSITVIFGYIAGLILTFIVIGIFVCIAVGFAHLNILHHGCNCCIKGQELPGSLRSALDQINI